VIFGWLVSAVLFEQAGACLAFGLCRFADFSHDPLQPLANVNHQSAHNHVPDQPTTNKKATHGGFHINVFIENGH
jgi:hypothetical protein